MTAYAPCLTSNLEQTYPNHLDFRYPRRSHSLLQWPCFQWCCRIESCRSVYYCCSTMLSTSTNQLTSSFFQKNEGGNSKRRPLFWPLALYSGPLFEIAAMQYIIDPVLLSLSVCLRLRRMLAAAELLIDVGKLCSWDCVYVPRCSPMRPLWTWNRQCMYEEFQLITYQWKLLEKLGFCSD